MRLVFVLLLLMQAISVTCNQHTQLLGKVLDPYIEDMNKLYHLQYEGGGGALMYEVVSLNLSFVTQRNVDEQGAKQLILLAAEELLKRINSYKPLRPYLHQFPFTAKNLELSISFKSPNRERVSKEYVSLASLLFGTIFYSHYDHEKDDFCDESKESYN